MGGLERSARDACRLACASCARTQLSSPSPLAQPSTCDFGDEEIMLIDRSRVFVGIGWLIEGEQQLPWRPPRKRSHAPRAESRARNMLGINRIERSPHDAGRMSCRRAVLRLSNECDPVARASPAVPGEGL